MHPDTLFALHLNNNNNKVQCLISVLWPLCSGVTGLEMFLAKTLSLWQTLACIWCALYGVVHNSSFSTPSTPPL